MERRLAAIHAADVACGCRLMRKDAARTLRSVPPVSAIWRRHLGNSGQPPLRVTYECITYNARRNTLL